MAMNSTTKRKLNKQLTRVAALAMTCVIGISSAVTVAALTKKITVVDGDNQIAVSTLNTDTGRVLELAGIVLGEGDAIVRDDDRGTITVLRAFTVTVNADGGAQQITLNQGTVADALQTAGISLGEHDQVTPDQDTQLTADMEISVERFHTLTLTVDGETQTYVVPEGTLEESLAYIGVTLGEYDTISSDGEGQEDMTVTVDRVEYRDVTITEEISYNTVTQEDDTLYQGEKKVATPGQTGERTIVSREKLINGEVTETETVSDEMTKEPVDEVILVGTKEKPAQKPAGAASVGGNGYIIDHKGQKVAYKSVLTGSCTAYSAAEGSMTATGRPVAFGNVAVNPNVIPYGTRLYICSPDGSYVYGYAIAADTGGALMSGRVLADLFYETPGECYNFGRRTMSVYILE